MEKAQDKRIKTVFVAGPTAAGKTEYAIKLAQVLDGEIVSADSMQIYKYMDIGSAKPTPAEQAAARHWLIDEIDPKDPFNASDYQKKALGYIRDIHSRGKLPIVCGGTGLYFNSLIYDMDFSAPAGDSAYRDRLAESLGNDPLRIHERLCSLDPDAAADIPAANVKRVLRAIERLEAGEEKLAPFASMVRPSKELSPVQLCLTRERSELYGRIDRRVDKLMEAGLVGEVMRLKDMGFTEKDIAMKGIGYKEILHCLENGEDPGGAADVIKLNTRHYAKRQITWFKRYPDMRWFTLSGDAFNEDVFKDIIDYIGSFVDSSEVDHE